METWVIVLLVVILGTAATMIENLHRGGLVRRAGRLTGAEESP